MNVKSSSIIAIGLLLGLSTLGYLLGSSMIKYKELDRIVTVKGLAVKEVKANIILWPIKYGVSSSNLDVVYKKLDADTTTLVSFLESKGFQKEEITISAPLVVDKFAQDYRQSEIKFRYSATQIITVYSKKIDLARVSMQEVSSYGKKGISFSSNQYENKPQYIYTKLNEIKPAMIDQATLNARQVAQKFATQSQSKLGKIKSARQGQFSIYSRDNNTPYIKRVRIVSTIAYYLVD